MSTRFSAVVLAAAVAGSASWALPAAAQTPKFAPPHAEPAEPIQPPSKLPRVERGDTAKNLDRLFAALKVAPTDESAKYIENRIWAIWTAAGGDTAVLLMERVKVATTAKDYDLAIKLLTAIIDIKPDYVEAWNRRATLYYLKKDLGDSLSDLIAVLKREPRHFGAWAGLGMIMQDIGEDKLALAALRHALALHPHLKRVPDMIKRLSEKVEGQKV